MSPLLVIGYFSGYNHTVIILGIDPGTTRAGYGLIQKTGSRLTFLKGGLLKTTSKIHSELLNEICSDLSQIISEFKPVRAGLEKLFFTKNQKTGIMVAEARGAILSTLSRFDIPIIEYTPKEVKNFLTGSGSSVKADIIKTVEMILQTKIKGVDDVADALALAILASSSLRI